MNRAEENMERIFREGHHLYQMNDDLSYVYQPLVEENQFLTMEKDTEPLPTYQESKDRLPSLIWDGRPSTVACFDKAWEIAFQNLRTPQPQDGMVSNYIDTAFNGFLFMWDSSFITMFGKYGSQVFDFQKTLDNFYARQHMDGFMCREICERVRGDQFHRFDPASTGPNILPWAEWESYQVTGDLERIQKVFPPLLAFHLWMKSWRTWPDGSYWSCGWGSMDNQPRPMPGCSVEFHHSWSVWTDACIQQILSGKLLARMARLLGREQEVQPLVEETARLTKLVNEKLWDPDIAFYCDLWPDGRRNQVKSIGAYWALLADIVPEDRLEPFIAHLQSKEEFNRFHRVPSLSADHPGYNPEGGYWLGGVWAPTNYMVLRGLEKIGRHSLAREIALNHVERVTEVFEQTGTLWENYAPEPDQQGRPVPGQPAKRDFVGWTGLSPIAIVIEQVFGIHGSAAEKKITWRIQEQGRHGVLRYPMGSGTVDLVCPAHAQGEKPPVEINARTPVAVVLQWPDGTEETIQAGQ